MSIQKIHLSRPGGKVRRPFTDDPPSSPHQAYVAGSDAAVRGDDLATVVYDALLTWPMEELPELAELITCASLGYWTAEGGH